MADKNFIAEAMNRGAAPEIATANAGIAQQVAYNPSTAYYDSAMEKLKNLYVRKAEERKRESRVTEASDALSGELLAQGSQPLPTGATEATKQAYDAVSFMKANQPAIQQVMRTYNTDAFLQNTAQDQNDLVKSQKEELLVSLQNQGLMTNEGAKKFLADAFHNMDIAHQTAVVNYNTVTLPSRTASDLMDITRTSVPRVDGADPATEKQWTTVFDSIAKNTAAAGMPSDTRVNLMYGEVHRMIDSGDLGAYNAFIKSPHYKELNTQQRDTLGNSAMHLMTLQHNERLTAISDGFKQAVSNAIATGDNNSVLRSLESISKLPPQDLEKVRGRVTESFNKYQKIAVAQNAWAAREAGDTSVTLDTQDANTVFDLETRKTKLAAGDSLTTQQAQQQVAMRMAAHGVISPKTQTPFDLTNPTFVNGAVDVATATALSGIDKLVQVGLSDRVIEDTIGSKSLDVYRLYQDYKNKSMTGSDAMSAAITAFREADGAELSVKNAKAFETIGSIDTRSIVSRTIDRLASFRDFMISYNENSALSYTRGLSAYSLLTTKGEQGIKAATDTSASRDSIVNANPEDVSGAYATIAAHNRFNMSKEFSKYVRKHPALKGDTLVQSFEDSIRQNAVIMNGNLLTDERAQRELTSVAGDRVNASKYSTEAIQIAAQMSALPPDLQKSVMRDSTVVYSVSPSGVIETLPDVAAQRAAVAKGATLESKLDLEKLGTFLIAGGKTSDGKLVPKILGKAASEAGLFHTYGIGGVLGRYAALNTRVTYLPDSNSFAVELLNRQGEPLQSTQDVIETNPYADVFSKNNGIGKFTGLGNIDLNRRPMVRNKDGSMSTVLSTSFSEDGKEILIPRVSQQGKILSVSDAIQEYHRTGEYLGKFNTVNEANTYAAALHQEQAAYYGNNPATRMLPAAQRAQAGTQPRIIKPMGTVFSTSVPMDFVKEYIKAKRNKG